MEGMHCKMNMVWTWDQPIGVCLVFPSLQITNEASLIFYLLFLPPTSSSSQTDSVFQLTTVVFVSLLYEYSRLYASASDRRLKESLRNQTAGVSTPIGAERSGVRRSLVTNVMRRESGLEINTEDGLLGNTNWRGGRSVQLPWSIQTKRSVLYVLNVAVSFWIMLIIMSYNAYLIGAVLFGAFLGHMIFQREILLVASDDDKGLACH